MDFSSGDIWKNESVCGMSTKTGRYKRGIRIYELINLKEPNIFKSNSLCKEWS